MLLLYTWRGVGDGGLGADVCWLDLFEQYGAFQGDERGVCEVVCA